MDFRMRSSGLVILLDDFLEDQIGAIREIRRLSQVMKNKAGVFRWDKAASRKFALLIAQRGINNIKPKELLQHFIEEGVRSTQLYSHLQKFKDRIRKDNGLLNMGQIHNHLGVAAFKDDE